LVRRLEVQGITIGQYIPGESVVHKADPRLKIAITILTMVLLLILDSFYALLLATIFVVSAFLVSKVSLRYALKGLKPVIFIVIFTMILNIFFATGTPLYTFWIITITKEGLVTSALVSVRILLLISAGSLMTYTTTPLVLTVGIERLMSPLKYIKVPTAEIAMMISIALRFIPTLMEETEKIMKAQAARGADIGTGNIFQRAKSFIPILIPLFISSFKRADDLAVAMDSRCYHGSEGRTSISELKYTSIDLSIFIVYILFVAAALVLQYAL
jgi:energy-coupling factor transport system permease protein